MGWTSPVRARGTALLIVARSAPSRRLRPCRCPGDLFLGLRLSRWLFLSNLFFSRQHITLCSVSLEIKRFCHQDIGHLITQLFVHLLSRMIVPKDMQGYPVAPKCSHLVLEIVECLRAIAVTAKCLINLHLIDKSCALLPILPHRKPEYSDLLLGFVDQREEVMVRGIYSLR